jgi:hypothetical protein
VDEKGEREKSFSEKKAAKRKNYSATQFAIQVKSVCDSKHFT